VDLARADKALKRVGIAVGLVVLVVIAAFSVRTLLQPPPSPPPQIQLAAVDVQFVGSGSSVATQANACGFCGTSFDPGGQPVWMSVDVDFPYEPSCTPHTWSVTQVAGASGGGFEISNVTGQVAGERSSLPVTVPMCAGGESYGSASLGYDMEAVSEGPSVQTLYLTVTVVQLS
jgi:hypothetical protein